MKITPIEIRQKSFEKKIRGFDKDEVSSYLLSLSHEWERLLDENNELKERLGKTESEVQKLREVENTLYKTLKTAEDTGANVVEQASKQAEIQLRESKMKSESMLEESKNKARKILEEAEHKAAQIMDQVNEELKSAEDEYHEIENLKQNFLRELKMLATDTQEKVKDYSVRDTHKNIKQKLNNLKDQINNRQAEEVTKFEFSAEQSDLYDGENKEKPFDQSPKEEDESNTSQSKDNKSFFDDL